MQQQQAFPQSTYLPPREQQPQRESYLSAPHEEPRRRRSSEGKEGRDSSRHGSSHGNEKDSHSSSKDKKDKGAKVGKDGVPYVQGKRRWGENLMAGGIGGAAVGLLSVLSEAAEGL
jgi:hypothetical protein